MEIQKLNEHNPWWTTKKIDDTLTCKERKEYDLLLKSVEIPEITIITGVRRSGKSTLMYQMIAKLLDKGINPDQILFVNLEDPKLSPDNIENIHDTYRNEINPDKKAYIFFDEIHRKNGWESWIRRQYDLKKYCKFIISGSSSYLLKREYSTLLTGRNLTFEVSPLSFKEFLEFKGVMLKHENVKKNLVLEKDKHQIIKSLTEYLQNGGFPNIFFKEKEFKTRMLVQYFDDILYKDIVDRYILNGQKARDLALYLMTNFTSLISLRNLRNTLGLSYESITNYISYYKEAFLFFTLEHFSYSLKEQKTNASKIYCIDNGLRNAVSFKFSKDEGKLVENCVFLELKRKQQNMYYWSNNNSEVDFVIKNSDNTLTIINVTYTDEVGVREKKGLTEFKKKYKKTRETIIITKNIEKKESGIKFIPLWKWLLEN